MSAELIINYREYETRVALVENGLLSEVQIERGGNGGLGLSGNIYQGRVARVLPGMQAAFVNIGQERAAFLYVDDVCDHDVTHARLVGKPEGVDYPQVDWLAEDSPPLIEELIREDQDILVQVSKEPIGQKGARITSHISLPGRLLVLMPTVNHLGTSRRIEDEQERLRLKEILERIRPQSYGFIARTSAEGASEQDIQAEVDFLIKQWSQIALRAKITPSPGLVHRELDATLRAVRDIFSTWVERLIVDDEEQYDKIKEFLEAFAPDLTGALELYQGPAPIFEHFNLENDLIQALEKKVWLKSGGYLVIEKTEALTVIDVNTGRYVGSHNLEETILKTNLEAVKEIAYQLRLRNIGGLVVIDFIDMEKEVNRERVTAAFREALKKDRNKTKVLSMSDLGLVEMTRKRTRESLDQMMCELCFYCQGRGALKAKSIVCHQALTELETMEIGTEIKSVLITVHPLVREFIFDEDRSSLEELERKINRRLIVRADEKLHLEEYRLALSSAPTEMARIPGLPSGC